MTGGAAVGVQGEEQRRKDAALGTSGADGLGVRDLCTQLNTLLPVRQEVCDPPAGGIRHVQLGELVLKQGGDDGIEGRAEVHKQDPCIGSLSYFKALIKIISDLSHNHAQRVQTTAKDTLEQQPNKFVFAFIPSCCLSSQGIQEQWIHGSVILQYMLVRNMAGE